MSGVLASCGGLPEDGSDATISSTSGNLSISYSLSEELGAAIEVLQDEVLVASKDADENGGQIFLLEAGNYDVRLIPTRDGEPAQECEAAEANVDIIESAVTQVALVATCESPSPGTLLVNASINYSPVLTDLEYHPSVMSETCEATTITAMATDPEGDDILYRWRLPKESQAGVVGFRAHGDTFLAKFFVAGEYSVDLEICDALGACTETEVGFYVNEGDEVCGPPESRQWRIRNATAPRANAWALRGLQFCDDFYCDNPLTGEVIDDGSAPHWGAPDSLFDDDSTDFWKSFASKTPGAGYVGQVYDEPTRVSTVRIRPDNIVYGVSEIFVEYYDEEQGVWMTHALLTDVPLHYGDIESGGPTYSNDVWFTVLLNEANF